MTPYIRSLYDLENKLTPQHLRKRVVDEHTALGVLAEYEFEVYLYLRMSQQIEIDKFLNIIQNIYVYRDLWFYLGGKLTNYLSQEYLKGNFVNYYQASTKEFKTDFGLLVLHRTVYHISHNYSRQDAISKLRIIVEDTKYSLGVVLNLFGTLCLKRGDKFKLLLYLDDFSLEERYDLFTESCRSNSKVFLEMEDALGNGEFYEYVFNRMADNDTFCATIRSLNTINSSLSYLEKTPNIRKLLFENAEKIPQTLEHILQFAVNAKNYDIVIQLGAYFPKKRILQILTSQGDQQLIEKFFFLYKHYSEIKRLAPFI